MLNLRKRPPPVVKKPSRQYVWQISQITGTPAAVIGRVETSGDKVSSAVKEAITRFGITDVMAPITPWARSLRLAARRVK